MNSITSRKSEDVDDFEEINETDLSALYDAENDAEEGTLFFSLTIKPSDTAAALTQPPILNSIVHITNACFGENVERDSRTVVVCQISDTEQIPICILNANTHENHSLDLLFNESASFVLRGSKPSAVTLTGYYQPTIFDELNADMEDEFNNAEMEDYVRRQRLQSIGNDDMSDNGETSSPVPIPVVIVSDDDDDKEEEKKVEKILSKKQKRKLKQKKINTPPPVKKRKVNDGSPELKNEEIEGKVDSVNSSMVNSVDSSMVNSVNSSVVSSPAVKGKKKRKKKKKMSMMKGGIRWRDMVEGKGAAAMKDSKLKLFYVGQLSDGTVFDKCISGNGFDFTLGKGEVIKGWDIGLKGMKVGAKRKLIIPAKVAYGAEGRLPEIPPNSNLTFTVELKSIN